MNSLMTLKNVSMSYPIPSGARGGRHTVFNEINLALAGGERLGIVGRNGTGKSTLLRIMAKIFAPSSGIVSWAPDTTVSLLSLGLGFRPDLTGSENALLACMLQGFSKQDALASLASIQDFAELEDYFNEPVKVYSAGMRARLGFATALKNRSKVILIDEVLSVGDQLFRDKASAALREEMSEDRAVVIVSHSEAQMRALSTKMLWLGGDGKRAVGEVDEIFALYNQ
jgi:lipopolysaccharide transport system ATP-binding protein